MSDEELAGAAVLSLISSAGLTAAARWHKSKAENLKAFVPLTKFSGALSVVACSRVLEDVFRHLGRDLDGWCFKILATHFVQQMPKLSQTIQRKFWLPLKEGSGQRILFVAGWHLIQHQQSWLRSACPEIHQAIKQACKKVCIGFMGN